MGITVQGASGQFSKNRSTREYVLHFHANSSGVAKRVELTSQSAQTALELAVSDAAERTVDVWRANENLADARRQAIANSICHPLRRPNGPVSPLSGRTPSAPKERSYRSRLLQSLLGR
jgi:hypothetical protein